MRKLIRVILALIFLASLFAIIWLIVIDPYLEQKNQDEIKEIYYKTNAENGSMDDYNLKEELKKINEDIVGWITIPDTRIDYPVLKPGKDDPDFYLTHDYKKENNKHGSIFLDSHCDIEVSQNLILHGHHMRDKTMFADLVKFKELSFYKSHPIIEFGEIGNIVKWKIMSVFRANTNPKKGEIFNYIQSSFLDDEDFSGYLQNIKNRSIINIPVDADVSDDLVTLSTCSYEFDGCRTVVVARKVRDGESDFVDVNSAW